MKLDTGFLIKVVVIAALGGGILFGSKIIIKNIFPERNVETDGQDFSELSHVIPQGDLDKASLSSEEVRNISFQEDFEAEGPRATDSLSFIAKPQGGQQIADVKKAKEFVEEEKAAEQAAAKEAAAAAAAQKRAQQQESKPKPRLKGFGDRPSVGSISGFKMKTEFGGLKKGAPSLSGNSGGFGSSQNEDDEEDEEDAGSFGKADLCKKICGPQSVISGKSQGSCKGSGVEWIDGACVDGKKLESCVESNPACK